MITRKVILRYATNIDIKRRRTIGLNSRDPWRHSGDFLRVVVAESIKLFATESGD